MGLMDFIKGELLEIIVVSDIPRLRMLLSNAMAISIRVDGSVDKFQIDSKFVMLKVVIPESPTVLIFLDLKSRVNARLQVLYTVTAFYSNLHITFSNLCVFNIFYAG